MYYLKLRTSAFKSVENLSRLLYYYYYSKSLIWIAKRANIDSPQTLNYEICIKISNNKNLYVYL